jgi:hypothetical protein
LDPELRALLDDARHAQERVRLYRAKVYGSRPSSLARLRELERIAARAQDRLRHAQRQQS